MKKYSDMIIYSNTMPYKLIIKHKQTNQEYTYYKSNTDYLEFSDEVFKIIYPPNYGTSKNNNQTSIFGAEFES